jgi:hypothetical protein
MALSHLSGAMATRKSPVLEVIPILVMFSAPWKDGQNILTDLFAGLMSLPGNMPATYS